MKLVMETIKIVCFGASMVEGYSSYGTVFTPYGNYMKKRLDSALSSTKVTVDIQGQSGDQVDESYGGYIDRLNDICKLVSRGLLPGYVARRLLSVSLNMKVLSFLPQNTHTRFQRVFLILIYMCGQIGQIF
jgi:hypothetical protein